MSTTANHDTTWRDPEQQGGRRLQPDAAAKAERIAKRTKEEWDRIQADWKAGWKRNKRGAK